MNIKWIVWSIPFLLLVASPVHAWRCSDGLVNIGDSTGQVRKKCGPPDYIFVATGMQRRGKFAAVDEYWYYNSGSQLLMRELQFHRGKLQTELTPAYGFTPDPRECTPQDIRTGMTAYELAINCGKPKSKRDRYVRIGGRGTGGKLMQHTQIWTYDFGSQYLLHKVTILNGHVQEQEVLGRSKYHAKHGI